MLDLSFFILGKSQGFIANLQELLNPIRFGSGIFQSPRQLIMDFLLFFTNHNAKHKHKNQNDDD